MIGDFDRMFLNLKDLENIPRYPGYPGHQLFVTLPPQADFCDFNIKLKKGLGVNAKSSISIPV